LPTQFIELFSVLTAIALTADDELPLANTEALEKVIKAKMTVVTSRNLIFI